MNLIPVLDVKQGQVVRGVAGERRSYRPNQSCLVGGSDPGETAAALVRNFQPDELYVADLDGLSFGPMQHVVLQRIVECGAPVWVDGGIDRLEKADELFEWGVAGAIVATECLPDLELLREFVLKFGSERIRCSLDLREGHPVGSCVKGHSSSEIVDQVVSHGVTNLVVLDVASVGMQRGVPTRELCHQIKNRHHEINLWTGGGVRSIEDFYSLQLDRIDGLLVASALHDGRITPSQWQAFKDLSEGRTQLAMDA